MKNPVTPSPLENFLSALFSWKKWSKYLEAAKTSISSEIAYPIAIFSDSVVVVFQVGITTLLYNAAYSFGGYSQINGVTIIEIVWMVTIVQAIRNSVFPAAGVISQSIKDGDFSYEVSKPYSYLLFIFAQEFGRGFPYFVINILFGSLACLVFAGPIHLTFLTLLLGLMIMLLGAIIDFLVSVMIGLSSMWIENSDPLWWIWNKGKMIFGGAIIPLAIMPDTVRKIAEYMPFSQVYYAAAQLIVRFDITVFWHFLSIQIVWIMVLGLLTSFVFNKGMKNVTANGG
jgi:ABC-2 type transport system permease protein